MPSQATSQYMLLHLNLSEKWQLWWGRSTAASSRNFLCCAFCSLSVGLTPPQVVHFPEARGPHELRYDAEWLAVLRGTHHLLSLQKPQQPALPGVHQHLSASSPRPRQM